MDRGAWQATVHRVTKNQTQLKWFRMHACTPSQGGSQDHTPCTLSWSEGSLLGSLFSWMGSRLGRKIRSRKRTVERWSGGANERTPELCVQEREAGLGMCTEAGGKGELNWGRRTPIKEKRRPCASYFYHQPHQGHSASYEVFLYLKWITHGLCCCCLVDKSYLTLLWPYGWQPARLLCPWDFLGKNTGVGCCFLLQGSSRPRDWTCVSCIGKWILYHWATTEVHTQTLGTHKTVLCLPKPGYTQNQLHAVCILNLSERQLLGAKCSVLIFIQIENILKVQYLAMHILDLAVNKTTCESHWHPLLTIINKDDANLIESKMHFVKTENERKGI